jgi:hypothetical protein
MGKRKEWNNLGERRIMNTDYVYYAMVREDDGTLRFPSGMTALDCFGTEEAAMEAARELGYNEIEIVHWSVD